MPIIIDDKTAEIFKIYDDLTQKYFNEINGYREIIKSVETMIQQKEIKLQEINEKTVQFLNGSISEKTVPAATDTIIHDENINYAGVIIETLETQEIETPGQASKTPTPRTAKNGKREIIDARKAKVKSPRGGKAEKVIKCLYHPETPAYNFQRRLCYSCVWKLSTNGLTEYDKDPDVIAFLKGKTKNIPIKGQPMCPVHPKIPTYNKKTGLCNKCQRKALAIGIKNRPLTDEELEMVRNPVT